jgi:hypothetical protein
MAAGPPGLDSIGTILSAEGIQRGDQVPATLTKTIIEPTQPEVNGKYTLVLLADRTTGIHPEGTQRLRGAGFV